MIWASIVSLPTLVARMRNAPVWLIVAPITASPAVLVTGIGSPVTIDSSTAERPSTTSPSTGIFSPGRTTTGRRRHVLDGDLDLGAVAHDPRGAGLQADQLADRLAGPGLGAGLQQPAQQDQRDDHADRFEVDLAHVRRQHVGRR